MRQNIKDIQPIFEGKGSGLRYGLSINLDMKGFTLKDVDVTKDHIDVQVSKIDGAIVNDSKIKSEIPNANEFDKFHVSNVKNILTITIKENNKLASPLEIDTKVLSNDTIQQINIVMEKNSEAEIIDYLEDGTDSKGYNSKGIQVNADKGSKLEYYHIQKLNKKKIHYSKKVAVTEDSAEVNWHDISIGGSFASSETLTLLKGDQSKSLIQSVFFSDDDQQFDISGQGIHFGRNTSSNVEARGVIKDKSKALYRGNIHMNQEAFDSEGFQRADLIILDDTAEVDAIPQLLIDNNEVKCSHAVAIGNIDPEKVFYLMSRGITENEAKHQIVRGFLEATIRNIKLPKIYDAIITEIEAKMK